MSKHTIFIIFGSTGDLNKRMLIPALFSIDQNEKLGKIDTICIGRKDFDDNEYRKYLLEESSNYIHDGKTKFKEFLKKISYHKMQIDKQQDYKGLKDLITKLKKSNSQVIFYLSTPPALFPIILENLDKNGLNKSDYRITFEKPFGHDLVSAQQLNDKISKVFAEDQIYRIDHYLGKEAIQNIIAFRFSNRIFEPLWSNHFIDNIQIISDESIGVENRGNYYDNYGALRDMIQNHMLQILSLVAMEAPYNLTADGIKNKKINVLRSIRIDENMKKNVVFGQYVGYKDELGVKKGSRTETFVAMKLCIDNRRFEGVPIYLRTGKKMKKKQTKVIIEFKKTPNILYNDQGDVPTNKIIFEINPKEGINVQFNIKQIGESKKVIPATSHFESNGKGPVAYHKLLKDIIIGDSTLFSRWDMIEQSWKIVDQIVNCKKDCPMIYKYNPGENGPLQAQHLLQIDGREWHE